MKIQWLGHSCFKLTESTGTTIVTDPYESYVGFEMEKVQADIVTISHHHKDHDAVVNVLGNPTIIDSVGSWEIGGVDICTLVSSHDDSHGKKRGENHIFTYRMDGIDVCHLGDIGEECTVKLADSIGTVNVLLIPVGGTFTINAEQAKEYVDLLMPDVVIPMHFKSPKSSFDELDTAEEFINLFEEDQILKIEGDTVEFDRETFDGETTKVVQFYNDKF